MPRLTRRQFLEDSMLAAAAASVIPGRLLLADENVKPSANALRIGVIGVRGRGRGHIGAFKKSPDADVVAICDPDEAVIGPAMQAVPNAKYYKDIRALLDDDTIDAVSIATPNHWHSLATIWALQAGKHVYVEKPISHDVFEGRAVMNAARKHGRLVQHGTQARSAAATRDALQWLREGGLGRVHLARGLCYKRRETIGKVDGPQPIPDSIDFDLWTGPADLGPLMRTNLHYDWHWVYNTGNGDIGNQGVHQMDIARWGLGLDGLPSRVVSCGGRLGYDDDGNTANTQVAVYDYGDKQIIFEVRGLRTPPYRGASIGVVFHCENGYLVSSSYAKVVAFDRDGNVIKEFLGDGNHFQNFLDAVKEDDAGMLNAECREGHISSALCHLGNVSYRLGTPHRLSDTNEPFGDDSAANESFGRFRDHLQENGLSLGETDYLMGPSLTFDPKTERFTGARAEEANAQLRRNGRDAYIIPENG